MEESRRYWVWLTQCFSYGSDKPRQLLEAGASPEALFQQGQAYREAFCVLTPGELERMGRISLGYADKILEDCERKKIWVLDWEDPGFPQPLKQIFGAPIVLYGLGRIEGVMDTLRLAVVGTRHSSSYAQSVATNLSYQLAAAGVTIISGCAVGIDACAHQGAIRAKGRTIGVLACGADIDYPSATHDLKVEMVRSGGALVTELPPGTTVIPHYIPTRNRLMSGLAEGVFVVQAPEKSGALITAELAIDQGRELFCLPPWNIFDPSCMGVAPFLRDGAKPVYEARDILDEYGSRWGDRINRIALRGRRPAERGHEPQKLMVADAPDYQVSRLSPPSPPPPMEEAPDLSRLTPGQRDVYSLLEGLPCPADEIIRQSGRKSHEILSILMELELMGLVRAYPGRLYGKASPGAV